MMRLSCWCDNQMCIFNGQEGQDWSEERLGVRTGGGDWELNPGTWGGLKSSEAMRAVRRVQRNGRLRAEPCGRSGRSVTRNQLRWQSGS